MDAAVAIARNAIETEYPDIPGAAVEAVKKDILDTLGTMAAGSAALGAREIVELMVEFGGREESTIAVYGSKAPAVSAAMANASMAHALDYDDTHDAAIVHAGVTIVPAAFAIAERVGRVSGRDFITAVALGIDVVCRMGLANKQGPAGWILTPVYGYFGAAIAAGKLLGLDEAKMISAMGIAYSQASGNRQCVIEGTLTKRMQAGFAARGGVMAALMAERGITGVANSLEGEEGLYNVYHRGDYNAPPLTAELGKRFEVADISFKPYPCCRITHPYIDAALSLRREHQIRPDDVLEITVFINREPHELCHPLEVRRNPRNTVDAQFSIPYAVACALANGKVGISDFTESAIQDSLVIGLANKVTPRFDQKMVRRELSPGMVEVKTRTGACSKYVDIAYGHPRNPMNMEAIAEKFRDCARNAVKALPEENVSGAIDMSSTMEELDDVGEIMRLLA